MPCVVSRNFYPEPINQRIGALTTRLQLDYCYKINLTKIHFFWILKIVTPKNVIFIFAKIHVLKIETIFFSNCIQFSVTVNFRKIWPSLAAINSDVGYFEHEFMFLNFSLGFLGEKNVIIPPWSILSS